MTFNTRGQVFNPLTQLVIGTIALTFALTATTLIDHQIDPPPPRIVPMYDDSHPMGTHTAHAM